MSLQSAETVATLAAAGFMPAVVLATSGDVDAAVSFLSVSAGLSGAIVAGLKSQPADPGKAGRLRWLPIVISGALAAVFVGPALAELFGLGGSRLSALVCFLTGLLGPTLCDEVLAHGPRLVRLLVRRGASEVEKKAGE